ncbi:MAG: LTA synthase family protein, partial [Herminiimonas sp.]|nr:LTA synthase family protein [Herminiimonas sp.]
LVSVAKEQVLREPFIYQDFDYFTDAIRHPRLYLPFLGWVRALLVGAVLAVAITGGMFAEAPITRVVSMGAFIILLSVLTLGAMALLWLGSRTHLAPVFRPGEDLARLGLIGSIWSYAVAERRDDGGNRVAAVFAADKAPSPAPGRTPATAQLPNLVVVQSESFFDARRLFEGIKPEILGQFDALGAASLQHGRLQVPAWGANTVRTEFGFLSALSADSLGVHRFNPYRRLARTGVPTLASHLRGQGYRTVCVHPYIAGFYDRDIVYPLMGFDEFIDIEAFADVAGAGPYIGDVEVADRVIAMLDAEEAQSNRPLFIFVITMENHGPLHLEKTQAGDIERLYDTPPPAGCDDLTFYLRHLGNADGMLARLSDRLRASSRAGCLCFYGDHVPIMASVYTALGEPDGMTEYLLWHSQRQPVTTRPAVTMRVEDLAGLILFEDAGPFRSER